MSATRTSPVLDEADTGCAGRYVTDGVHLYRLLEPLGEDAHGLTGVEDCRSLEIVLVRSSDVLGRMRPVATG
jgi:hypothetical protein